MSMPRKSQQQVRLSKLYGKMFDAWLKAKGLGIEDFVRNVPGTKIDWAYKTRRGLFIPREATRRNIATVYPDCPLAKVPADLR